MPQIQPESPPRAKPILDTPWDLSAQREPFYLENDGPQLCTRMLYERLRPITIHSVTVHVTNNPFPCQHIRPTTSTGAGFKRIDSGTVLASSHQLFLCSHSAVMPLSEGSKNRILGELSPVLSRASVPMSITAYHAPPCHGSLRSHVLQEQEARVAAEVKSVRRQKT